MSMCSASFSALLLAADNAPRRATTWLEIIQAGGLIGYLILLLSVVAVAMVILHLVQIRRSSLIPPHHVDTVDAMLARGDVGGALEYCLTPENDCYLTRILAAGLTRFQRSVFGVFEIKSAIEEAGEEETGRLYRSTDAISVIGSIAPLMGLLGTVLGMVGAFDTLAAGASTDNKTLASNISLALVTTLLGLILAIPCMALFTFFRNRIDALAVEAGQQIERLLLHLESSSARPTAPPSPTAMRPVLTPRPAAGSSTG